MSGLNDEEILQELFDSSSDKEEEDVLETESEPDNDYDSDADPEYIPEKEDFEEIEQPILEDIRNVEEGNNNQDISNVTERKRKKKQPKERTLPKKRKNRKRSDVAENEVEEVQVPTIISITEKTLVGKDKKFLWRTTEQDSNKGKVPAKNVIHIKPGSTPQAKNCLTPESCFKLFISENIMMEILTNTNKEIAVQREKYADKSHSSISDLEMEELNAILGLLVLAAALKDNHLSTRIMFDTTYCGERYRSTTSERRFKFVLNCLKFDDKETRAERRVNNKLAPISNIWEMLLTNCRNNYKPGSYLTIDEQLVGFRGRCPFRMYIPSKPNKYGIKVVMCCDSGTKYMIDAKPYLGKGTYPAKVPASTYFVEQVIQTVKNSNRNLTLDNWFTTVPLVQRLLHEFKLTVVGTMKRNKPQLPIEATDKDFQGRGAPTSLFLFHDDMTVVSFKPNTKKLVVLVSSMHSSGKINEDTQKPDIVHIYNSTKGGVDSFDQMCQNMNHGRKTRRWPLCFFYNMLNISSINAYVIYAHNLYSRGQKPLTRQEFMLELHKNLTEKWLKVRLERNIRMNSTLRSSIMKILGTPQQQNNVTVDQQGPRKYCSFCHYSKRRHTTTYCKCGKPICREHAIKACQDCA